MKQDKNNYDDLLVKNHETVSMIAVFWWILQYKEENTKIIKVEEGWYLKYLFICIENAQLNLEVETCWENAHIEINGILLAKWGNILQSKVHVQLKHHKGKAKVHLVSFLKDDSSCTIDGNIIIKQWTHNCDGQLLEENIVLGKNIQVKTLPMLDVQSNDVVASHGAKIEKLDPQKLFYMQAKGIAKDEAKKLLIVWYFEVLFKMITHDICASCEEKICSIKNELQIIKAIQQKYLEYLLQ